MNSIVRVQMVRALMVLFWISTIFAFLCVPLLSRFFYEQKSLNLFIWPMILDAQVMAEFEKESGIKVYVNYYESNEELYSKLQATGGKGFDVVVPTDYMAETLIKNNLLKKMDYSKLEFSSHVKPHLMGHYFDPKNEYSVPYYVSVFGLGINKEFFGGTVPTPSWDLVFKKDKVPCSFCMIDSTREALLLAGYYLYGSIENLDEPTKLRAIQDLLIEQKNWLYIYSSFRVEELLASKSCPLSVGTSADVWKAQHEDSDIAFIVPHEGTFVTIDSFVIPKATNKDELIYKLINFLYRRHVVLHNSQKYGFCSPITTVEVDPTIFCPTPEQFAKFQFFKNIISPAHMQEVWLAVKAY